MSKTWLNALMCRCTTELTSHCLIVLFTVTVPLKNDFSFLKSKSLPDCVWAAELWHSNNKSWEAVSSALCHTWDRFPVTVSCDGTATETSSLLTSFQSNRRAFLFNQRRSAAAARHAELRASVRLIIKKQKQRMRWCLSKGIRTFWQERSFGGSTSWACGLLKRWSGRAPRDGRSEPESHQNDSSEWIWGSMFFSWRLCCFQSEEKMAELSIQSAEWTAS